ncbi:MAG: partition protein parA [Cycloclasticus sp.]|nr:MAG: partition protein parA [Cycloclasticus sp.]
MKQRRIVVVSQKGGVGKSTFARSLAVEFTKADWRTKIIDMDTKQGTSTKWAMRRQEAGIEPAIQVESNNNVASAVNTNSDYQLLIFDGQPHASSLTREAAEGADLVIIPLKAGEDEIDPAIDLARELHTKAGVDPMRIFFLFNQIADENAVDVKRTYELIERQGYPTSDSYIRNLTSYNKALSEGRGITEVSHPKVKAEAEAALNDIVGHFYNLIEQEKQEKQGVA